MEAIIIKDAKANNLKNISTEIKYNELTVCVGVSGSGKTSFAFDTLINGTDCIIFNKPKKSYSVSQRVSDTKDKCEELLKNINQIKQESLLVVDEPLAGTTHDEAVIISDLLFNLAHRNNAVVVVEHRLEIIEKADKVIVFGPESGVNGGEIIDTTTGGNYLAKIKSPQISRKINESKKELVAKFKEFNGINNFVVNIKVNQITAVTGDMNSNKSNYINAIFNAYDKSVRAGNNRKNLISVKNKSLIRRPHIIDATPVSKNKRSTVATYYGISKFIEKEQMDITIKEAMDLFKDNNKVIRRLEHLQNIGLDYLKLNQPSYSLSGGECQRIKLATLLCKKLGDRSIYIFDNPVRGLGMKNIANVMISFDKLVKNNNTVLIAENDPFALKYVDTIIKV
jgi:excinuclease UvrABC ATPase subunit